jgi:hypothetical protein
MSAKDLLLAAVAHEGLTPVPIPEVQALDGKVYVRIMTAGERQLYAESALKARDAGSFIADYEIVAICACEADGTPMFHERQPDGRLNIRSEDVARLLNVDGRAIAAIAGAAMQASGLDAGAAERAKKNSESPPNDASSSDSPPDSGEVSENSSTLSTRPNSSNGTSSTSKSRGAMTSTPG